MERVLATSTSEWGRWIQSFRTYDRTDPLERLLSQTERQAPRDGQEVGCLLFTGSTKNGYAVVSEGHSGWHYGHRLAYERLVGPIPADRPRLHHECETRSCVEVSHLTPVSASDHAREHGLGLETCPKCGFNDWYVRKDTGRRWCRECRRRNRRKGGW